MKKILSSLANCSVCPLLDAPSCIAQTNCRSDLSEVEVVFVSENPGKDEAKRFTPLVGKSGKTFRKPFDEFIKTKFNWLLTNCVLCCTIKEDGTTGNPEPEVIELCKENCFRIIEACKPKLIVLMGQSPVRAFGLGKTGVTQMRGNFYEWRGYKVFVTVHPSYVNRNLAKLMPVFEGDIQTVAETLGAKKEIKTVTSLAQGPSGVHRYEIPKKFYTSDYRLIDVQYLTKENRVLYIFRDKDNNKVYHKETDEYVCYMIAPDKEPKKIVPYDDLYQVRLAYRARNMLDSSQTYEGDVRLTAKHAMDYYHFNEDEAPKTSTNIMYFDIEIDTGESRTFPDPKRAAFPINMISTILNGHTICYIIDNGTEPIKEVKDVEMKIFDNEKKLLLTFIRDLKDADPDYMSGWNSIAFDMQYIYNRIEKLGISRTSVSKFGDFYVDHFRCTLMGMVILDQEFLYRTFTFTKMENYKLGFIAQHELGETKVELDMPINEMYYKALNKLIEYNIQDTQLLEKLENKLQHINLLNEIRTICNTSFESGSSSMSQVDSLMISFLKKRGLASKNTDADVHKEEFPGAFVLEPIPGIYNKVADLDFASLYPSLIMTYNIGINNFVMRFKDPSMGYLYAYDREKLPQNLEVIVDPALSCQTKIISKKDFLAVVDKKKMVVTINGCIYQNHEENPSIFSDLVEYLVQSRKVYKKQMLEAKEEGNLKLSGFYDTRQLTYKVLSNSVYGVIANKVFRFFNIHCASSITLSGQEALKKSILFGNAYMEKMASGKEIQVEDLGQTEVYGKQLAAKRTFDWIVTGDTDSIFVCFQDFPEDLTVEEIEKKCESLQEYLNQEVMINMLSKHNVSSDKSRLVLKNELVIERGLFLAKKRYALKVVRQEGKDVTFKQYMGLEIKRSDYPRKSKEFLSELLDIILDNPKISIKNLMSYVHSQESVFRELIQKGDKSIARPVSFGRALKDYKSVPQGVKAMLFWNSVMYNIHVPGSRAYMFWINGVDDLKAPEEVVKKFEAYKKRHGNIAVVALPDEENHLPDYFIRDTKATLKFVFHDRYNLLLEPILSHRVDF